MGTRRKRNFNNYFVPSLFIAPHERQIKGKLDDFQLWAKNWEEKGEWDTAKFKWYNHKAMRYKGMLEKLHGSNSLLRIIG